MRLHIIRHADPDYVKDGLTALGKSQARVLSMRMENLPLVRIYSSPLGRVQDTARYTSERTGITVETLDWLREMDELKACSSSSELQNPVVVWNLPGHQLRQVKAENDDLGINSELFPQPQTVARFSELRNGWIEWLRQNRIEVTPDGWTADTQLMGSDIAIFCHHGVGLALLSLVVDIPVASMWRSFWLSPASVSTVLLEQYDKHRINPRLICLGDTGHLSGHTSENNTSGLLYNTR